MAMRLPCHGRAADQRGEGGCFPLGASSRAQGGGAAGDATGRQQRRWCRRLGSSAADKRKAKTHITVRPAGGSAGNEGSICMMDRNQTALHAALDAAHRERDARTSRDYARRRAAKNRKPPVDLFTAQLGLPSDWRDGFMQESVREHQRRRLPKAAAATATNAR